MEIHETQIAQYLEALFGNHEWAAGEYLVMRGVGEKGTERYGQFSEDTPLQPALYDPAPPVASAAERYASHDIGTFIVPAILSSSRAVKQNVKLLPAVVLDLDDAPAWQAIQWLEENFATPSIIVGSGGVNEFGPKLHAYYLLEEPLPPEDVVPIAVKLAEMSGADPSFMRQTQPIRVPGTVHRKDGVSKPVTLERHNDDTFTKAELEELLEGLAPAPWAEAKPMSRAKAGLGFSSAASADSSAILTTSVREGGQDGITRWDAFSRVAGHYLHVCRQGAMTPEEAFAAVTGWVEVHMVPAWPAERVQKEFSALYHRELAARGPFPEVRRYEPIVSSEDQSLGLRCWAAHRWVTHPKPTHSFLVEEFVIRGEPHLFVAEGGAGKTFLLADLAMKIATFEEGAEDLAWCGQKIVAGGTCVLILCEDSQTEMHIRLLDLDRDGMISRAGDRLIVLPMTRIGGSFPLAERDPKTGLSRPSQRWTEMLQQLKMLPDLALVAIDTLNSVSHGDENSAVVISEMMREAHRVCGELGAALVINHHLRKNNEPVRSLEELRDAIRGSTAIPSYFRINFGMFRATDWERRCRALNVKPHKDSVWRMGIAKANIMGLYDGEKTLLRTEDRGTIDVSDQDPFNHADMGERIAWVCLAVREAAKAGYPFGRGGKNANEGLYQRRNQLPDAINRLGYRELGHALEFALEAKQIVACAAKGEKAAKWLDVPSGPFAMNDAGEDVAKGAWRVPDWSRWVYDPGQCACAPRVSESEQSLGFHP